ncbi:uncharacterized protein LOC111920569 [Lactuca sativa]|uniref:uncharacterized protein LOC111920569 n=1 Tax=Lactuca sativa TaxID=4236 RepID=UPI000CB470EC|nr:uncharacterized protein LOC111920569 [Lactuca sativa]
MVVCKCRKATKLYCFVHKVPVCGECICFEEHQICVVGTYSAWVVDGEYDWPTKCCHCQTVLTESNDPQITRLGCLHNIHTNCLVSHIKNFPQDTAPDGFTCPACSTPIWPPKNVKNSGSRLHSQLKEAIMQSGNEKSLFGNHPISSPPKHSHGPPPAFDSDPLKPKVPSGNSSSKPSSINVVEKDAPHEPNFSKSPNSGATTRKTTPQGEKLTSEFSYYADDEDANKKKYTRRGSCCDKFLRSLVPFWSSALPTLPVTAPPKKEGNADDTSSRHHRPSRMDPRKILLVIAIMACLATMGVLYYRIAQHGLEDKLVDQVVQQ